MCDVTPLSHSTLPTHPTTSPTPQLPHGAHRHTGPHLVQHTDVEPGPVITSAEHRVDVERGCAYAFRPHDLTANRTGLEPVVALAPVTDGVVVLLEVSAVAQHLALGTRHRSLDATDRTPDAGRESYPPGAERRSDDGGAQEVGFDLEHFHGRNPASLDGPGPEPEAGAGAREKRREVR